MATSLVASSQFMSSALLRTSSETFSSSGGIGASVGSQLGSSLSTTLRQAVSKQSTDAKRSVGMSAQRGSIKAVLEAPFSRINVPTNSTSKSDTSNPTEVLLEKFAAMGPPNDTELSHMKEAADRLFLWDEVPKLATKQTFTVYELNEFDRDSPAFLELSRQTVNKVDPNTGAHIKALGDQVPFTNKLYDSTLEMRLGITTGICLHMKNYPGRGAPELHSLPFFTPDHYETIMSWYFGDMGHISGMGPFVNFQDTLMGITGGTGFFAEAKGVVRLHPLTPFKFMYTFTLSGIPELPRLLTKELVPPHFEVESHPDALNCKPNSSLPNYTN